jgi:Secretion system C-terminal sorting domain
LSNNNILICGTTNNLSWLPSGTAISTINLPDTVLNTSGTNKIPFLLYCNDDLTQVLQVVRLNTNDAEDIRFIKFTNQPGVATGQIYLSGNTNDLKANNGGYFIGKLNNNFVNGMPTAFVWATVYALKGSYIANAHPWDVNGTGQVYYGTGESHSANWAAIHSLDANTGVRRVVNNWLTHWYDNGAGGETEYKYGTASTYPGATPLKYSGIPLKHGRCEFRSRTTTDYNTVKADENGSLKMGKMPFDFLFKQPCDISGNTTGKGYNNNANGYQTAGATSNVMGLSSITCDRRNNWMYVGINSKSTLPSGLPDFEPAIIAYENDEIMWWDRLYKEANIRIGIDTIPNNSTPDQYIDAIAFDYAKPDNAIDAEIVVAARQHGNNTISLWNARTSAGGVTTSAIVANPNAKGFKDRFMGSSGNIHIGWLGRLKAKTGVLHDATYVAEIVEAAANYGAASSDLHLDGWPDPNSGNADLNTTYIQKNQVQVTGDGHVLIIAKGRRTLTTANAYQKMPPPSSNEKGAWNNYVREYRNDLSYAKYSSLIAGDWDRTTGAGGDNDTLFGVCKTAKGIITVGCHTGVGLSVPLANIPSWGTSTFNGVTGLIAYVQNDSIKSVKDNGIINSVLPVKIIAFNATCSNNNTTVLWQVETETNIKKYIIEYSIDGLNFEAIGTLQAVKQLAYTFNTTLKTKGFFRLKIIENDNSFIYSIVRALHCNNEKPQLNIYTQPIKDNFTIELNDFIIKNATLKIVDVNGKLIYRSIIKTNKINLSATALKLKNGIYIVHILQENILITQKIVIAN